MKKFIAAIIPLLIVVAVFGFYTKRVMSSANFYIGSDKSFGTNEMPYVNLEGPRLSDYEFRVYKIDNPAEFFKKAVDKRVVKEKTKEAFADPVALFKMTFLHFKMDLLTFARKDLNPKTRRIIKKMLGVDYSHKAYSEEFKPAKPAVLTEYPFLRSFTIPSNSKGWSFSRVPVPVSGDGIYLIEAVNGNALSYTVIIKSNIAFVTKQSSSDTIVFVAEKDTGKAVESADVIMIDEKTGEQYFTGKTDDDGLVKFNDPTREKSLVIVKKESNCAVSDPDYYAKSFFGVGGITAFLYTDRPVYRPADTVYFKGVVRNFSSDKYSVASGQGSVEILNPEGKTIVSGVPAAISSDQGSFSGEFNLPDDPDIMLGVYTIVLNFNNKKYSSEFSVEAYKKPTFLVTATVPKNTYVGSQTIPVKISAKYHYGAPLANMEVDCKVFRRAKYYYSPVGLLPFFADAGEYLGLSDNNNPREVILEKKLKLNDDGAGEFSFKPENITDDYVYTIIASATAENSTISGSTSLSVNRCAFFIKVEKENALYSPGDKAEFKVSLVPFDNTLTPEEKKEAVSGIKIKSEFFTRDFRNISQEAGRKLVDSEKNKTDEKGSTVFKYKIPSSGHFIAEFSAEDNSGEETISTTALWASSKEDSITTNFKNLTLSLNKDIYQEGDTAELFILTPASGAVFLITIEGDRIFKTEVVKIDGNTLKYPVKIKEEMMPNFTVSVVQFAANEVFKNEIKIVAPPVQKFLTVDLKTDKAVYKPGESVTIDLSTMNHKGSGESAEVSVAVVDEAVYQIQEDKNPKLSTYFYSPRRNNVGSVYSSEYKFYGYAEEANLKLALNKKKNPPLAVLKELDETREKFKDTAYWTAKVMTDASGKASLKFLLPDNLTKWRITALAITPDTKVGQTTAAFTAKKDFMVKGVIPSYIIKGEEFIVSANLRNITNNALDANVAVEVKGGVITGEANKTTALKANENKTVYFKIKTEKDMKQDSLTVVFKGTAGSLSDAESLKLPAKNYGVNISNNYTALIDGSTSVEIPVSDKYKNVKLEMLLSPGRGSAVRESLSYLADYPYGCIEQTMSRFMPLLAAKKVGYISPELDEKLPKMTAAGINLIRSHQKPDGGFGWFSEKDSDAKMTAFVYKGMAICKKINGKSDDDVMVNARRFLYDYIAYQNPDDFTRVYILGCLSEAGKIEDSMLNKALEKKSSFNLYTKALMAVTLVNSGRIDEAKEIYKDAIDDSGYMKKDYLEDKSASWETDDVECASALLLCAARLNEYMEDQEVLSELLIRSRSGIAWKNSRDTAEAVLAISEYLAKAQKKETASEIAVSVNGQDAGTFTASPDAVLKGKASFDLSTGSIVSGKNTISFEKKSGEKVYASIVMACLDTSESFKSIDNGTTVSRNYYKVNVGSDGKLNTDSTNNFKIGDLVMVELEISKNKSKDSYFIIEDTTPSGFSVVRNDDQYYSKDVPMEYFRKMIYDDRTVFFGRGDSLTVRYFLRADIPGSYKVLPAKAGLMYYPLVNGMSADDTVNIKE